jgi:hypothetical protein
MEGARWLLLSFARADEVQAAATLHVSPPPCALLSLFLLWERLSQPVAARGCLGGAGRGLRGLRGLRGQCIVAARTVSGDAAPVRCASGEAWARTSDWRVELAMQCWL